MYSYYLLTSEELSEPEARSRSFVERLIDRNKKVYTATKIQKKIELGQERGRINLLKLERIGEASIPSVPE